MMVQEVNLQDARNFLTTQRADIDLQNFVINLILTAALCWIVSRMYWRFGNALSNRRLFARNFVILGMTTMLIITVVKSSLALSLGLVGALSIVRFRAAIKEPEELAYLFLVISIGLGFGADQRLITIVAIVIIGAAIWIRSRGHRATEDRDLHLDVSSRDLQAAGLSAVLGVLQHHCPEVNLKRVDETKDGLEASFVVAMEGLPQLEAAISELRALHESLTVTLMDYQGLRP